MADDQRGSLPILFALALIPLIGFAGGAIDYGRSVADRTRLDSALDAAVIIGAQAATSADINGKSDAEIADAAKKAASDFFSSAPKVTSVTKPVFDATIVNRSVRVTGDYTSATATSLMQVLGFSQINLSGHSQSSVDLSPKVDVYLLVDVSGSMAIGATNADISILQSKLTCAFACHDGKKVGSTNYDAFEWAQANGIKLRLNEMNTGITDFISWLQTQPSASKRIRVALYSFSSDLTRLVDITSDLSRVSRNLPSAPSASSETAGGTHFKENMPQFAAAVGTSGDGSTLPKKLVIIATDGVQDQDRTWSHYGEVPARTLGKGVAPFDPAACRQINPSVSVGVLYTPYISLPDDWGYRATLGQPSQIGGRGTRFDDIIPQLQACVSAKDYFVNAAATASVGDAFKRIFQTFTSVTLSQ